MTYLSGPVNIQQGNTADFVVEYVNATGGYTVPATGELSVVYTDTAGNTTTDTQTLTVSNSFFIGSWDSATAALGLAIWTVTANSTTVAATGQIRVIERQAD